MWCLNDVIVLQNFDSYAIIFSGNFGWMSKCNLCTFIPKRKRPKVVVLSIQMSSQVLYALYYPFCDVFNDIVIVFIFCLVPSPISILQMTSFCCHTVIINIILSVSKSKVWNTLQKFVFNSASGVDIFGNYTYFCHYKYLWDPSDCGWCLSDSKIQF